MQAPKDQHQKVPGLHFFFFLAHCIPLGMQAPVDEHQKVPGLHSGIFFLAAATGLTTEAVRKSVPAIIGMSFTDFPL